jgi:hypothetical protein
MVALDKEPYNFTYIELHNLCTFILELLRIARAQTSNIRTRIACTFLEAHDLSKLVIMLTFKLPLVTSQVFSLPSWNGQYTMKFFFN